VFLELRTVIAHGPLVFQNAYFQSRFRVIAHGQAWSARVQVAESSLSWFWRFPRSSMVRPRSRARRFLGGFGRSHARPRLVSPRSKTRIFKVVLGSQRTAEHGPPAFQRASFSRAFLRCARPRLAHPRFTARIFQVFFEIRTVKKPGPPAFQRAFFRRGFSKFARVPPRSQQFLKGLALAQCLF
jgi:hypothetical protein